MYVLTLKMDRTKKVYKKLQGHAENTANLATNVSNERGELMVSVLNVSEGMEDLKRMADGLCIGITIIQYFEE